MGPLFRAMRVSTLSFRYSSNRFTRKHLTKLSTHMVGKKPTVVAQKCQTPPDKLQLLQEVQACVLCNRMGCSRRVLSDLNGDWGSHILFVAEAPGRLGAEKTGIPLFGDRTGDR